MIYQMSELNRRAAIAVQLTEAYAMDPPSRIRWLQRRGLDLTSTASTGIQGTGTLGLNWGQLAWRAINFAEDTKESAEREWENAKFVASSMAGKGIDRIHSSDKRRRQKERDLRLEARDKIIRSAIFGEEFESETKDGRPMQVARTVEELADQLERDLRGEKDWHDRVVEAHERQVQDQLQQRAQAIQTLHEEHRQQFGDNSLVGATSFDGLSPEEVQFRLQRRRQIIAQRMASAQVFPELTDPRMASFYDKWQGRVPAEGGS